MHSVSLSIPLLCTSDPPRSPCRSLPPAASLLPTRCLSQKSGDKQTALEHLFKSETAMKKANDLAMFHAEKAIEALLRLPESEARNALVRLTWVVITRKK